MYDADTPLEIKMRYDQLEGCYNILASTKKAIATHVHELYKAGWDPHFGGRLSKEGHAQYLFITESFDAAGKALEAHLTQTLVEIIKDARKPTPS
jgi:hypothetical protein